MIVHILNRAKECGTEKIKPNAIEVSSHNTNEKEDVTMKDVENRESNKETAISKVQDQNVDERVHDEPQEGDETDESSDSDRNELIITTNTENEENKKLVNQEESFEELPYVPTTLPLER